MTTRVLAVLIALSCAPFLYLLTDGARGESLLFVFANISGFIAAVVLWWQFALGVRPVSRLFSIDRAALVGIHIWLGTYGVLMVLVHGVLQLIEYQEGIAFLLLPRFENEFYTHLAFGQIALMLTAVVWVTSAVVRGSIAYRPWKYIHYVSYPAGALVYLHALEIGTYLGAHSWLTALWYAMAISYLLFLLWRIAETLFLAGYPYRIQSVTPQTDTITTYVLEPETTHRITPNSGQHVYLTLHRFGESHPFSVMGYNQATGALTLGIKAFGRFTKKLAQVSVGTRVRLSAPYGAFTIEGQNGSPKVLIAGGIGVTPFIPLVAAYPNDTYLFNCNQTFESALARTELKAALGDRYIDIIEPERISVAHFGVLPERYLAEAKFFLCGPAGLMRATKKHLASLGVSPERIFTEEFAF